MKLNLPFLRFGTTPKDVNARVIPAYYVPTNYIPAQVSEEGTDKISSNLKGIDNALSPKNIYEFLSKLTSLITVSNSTLTLDINSNPCIIFTGSIDKQIVNLGDAKTYYLGKRFLIINDSQTFVQVNNFNNSQLYRIEPFEEVEFYLKDFSTENGQWSPRATNLDTNKNLFRQYTDWYTNTVAGETGWGSSASGSGAANTIVSPTENNNVGIVQLSTGNTNSGCVAISQGLINAFFSGGPSFFEALIKIPTLSVSNQRFIVRCGFGDLAGNGDFTDGVYFEYNEAISPYLLLKSANNSSRTQIISSFTINANTWYRLRVEINYNGTLARFWSGDTFLGEISTNIPITSTRVFSGIHKIEKTVGNTARTLLVDYTEMAQFFNVERG